ncbi:MAG: hypothetical protein RL375_3398 [Pseudomonadota bacterium]
MSRERRDALRRTAPSYDLAAPPVGARLNLGEVALRLRVTVTDMATATGISRTAVADLLTNKWPVKTPPDEIRTRLRELMELRGATDDELATLFHALAVNKALRPAAAAPLPMPPHAHSAALATAAAAAHPEDPDMLLPKQTLTPQARRHFKLFTNPFDGEVTSDAMMFSGDDFAYVREALWQCSQTGGFVALVGESGAGKTTVLQDLEARLLRDDRSVIVIRPSVLGMEGNDTKGKAIKSADILHAIITALDANAPVPQTLQARTVRAAKMLTASTQAGASHLLVVEEAHSMPDATLKHLKRLHEMRLGRKPMLGILLVAQPELKLTLANGLLTGMLREVAQRCEIVELLPLDSALKAYLETRAAAAGVKLSALIDDAAIEQMRQRLTVKNDRGARSMCYPLAVNNLLTRALNKAAEMGWPTVTVDVIKSL